MDLLWPGSPIVFLLAWFGWRIACKAGFSGFWGLTAIIPPIGLVALWYLAATKQWPGAGGGASPDRDQPVSGGSITIRRPSEPARQQQS